MSAKILLRISSCKPRTEVNSQFWASFAPNPIPNFKGNYTFYSLFLIEEARQMINPPVLNPIDSEMLLFGSVHIEWSDCGVDTYYVFRDQDPIDMVEGYMPYAIVERKTFFDDSNFKNNATYYYAIVAIDLKSGQQSKVSNSERVRINLPAHLIVEQNSIAESAYFESMAPKRYDEKIWQFARLQLILETTFPNRDVDYLRIKVRSLKHDLPEFKGLFIEPTESEIRKRAQLIYENNQNKMEIDWKLAEMELIMKKIQELLEFQKKVR
jgi:hypothetical protein